MAKLPIPHTTPVKPCKAPPVNRKGMEKHIPSEGLEPCATFCEDRLNGCAEGKEVATDSEILDAVSAFVGCTQTAYDLVSKLMNTISRKVHEKYMPSIEVIVFIDVHSKNMVHHPNQYFDFRPDLIAVLASVYEAFRKVKSTPSCHHILSLVEEKLKIDMHHGPAQCGTYLGLANQARPDMVFMLGLAVCPQNYRLQYSCASGLVTSLEFAWDNLGPLIDYVYTLYYPKAEDPMFDPTIKLSKLSCITDGPLWDVQAQDITYTACKVKAVGSPWHRMSWVAGTNDKKPLIIKDSYIHDQTTYSEKELFDVIHEDGPAPGFAVIDSAFDVECDGRAISVTVDDCTRIKKRLIMSTSGDPLCWCPSVLTFLKVMYDILETHRWAVRERGILHRDISHGNILINAVDAKELPRFEGKRRAKYITEVLNPKEEYAAPLGRLIDLDNGTKMDAPKDDEKTGNRRRRTASFRGTPRFIARSVAAGEICILETLFQSMPSLDNEVLAIYEKAYPVEEDDSRALDEEDQNLASIFPRQRYFSAHPDNQVAAFWHQPRHDAESVFWCIIVFLIRALPKGMEGTDDDTHIEKYKQQWKLIATHEITASGEPDSRSGLLRIRNWDQILHPSLVFVAPLICELALQVAPEYALLEPPPNMYNVHEAMQRILLKYIYKFEQEGSDVELNIEKTRTNFIHVSSFRIAAPHHSYNGLNTTKRTSEALEVREESQSKRLRKSVKPPEVE